VTRHGSTALVAGDILAGEVCLVVYDGTRFQLLNPASYTNLNVSGVLSLAAGAVGTPSLAASGDPNTGLWFPAADTVALSTGGAERWRVDSSGNLGVGTANPGTFGKFASVAASGATSVYTGTGVQGLFISTNESTRVVRYDSSGSLSGLHAWGNGPTELMRLDSSGNLGIGTSSPGSRLDVSGNGIFTVANAAYATAFNASSGNLRIIPYVDANFGTNLTAYNAGYAGLGPLSFDASRLSFYTGSTERARITSDGNIVAGASAALATNATNGFLYVPTCAGVPTGTPTAISGMVPIVVDTTNNRWYFYSGGAWRNAGP
jgi:hypothetical protein